MKPLAEAVSRWKFVKRLRNIIFPLFVLSLMDVILWLQL